MSAKAASAFFFYPLAIVVSLAALMHLDTIAYMIRVRDTYYLSKMFAYGNAYAKVCFFPHF